MKNSICFILLVCIGIVPILAQDYKTITYYKDDTLELNLDVFIPETPATGSAPLFIYVHGGGFAGGDRTSGHKVCRYLAKNGIVTATISYTLYMKGKNFSCGGVLSEKVKAMQFGANHLWLATNFFIQNKDIYNIDTSKIFIGGSSAGAETVLHATYWDYNLMNWYKTKVLPKDFKYKGLVAGAGAIMDLNLITEKNQIPMLMFHGNSDVLVPYGTAAHHYCPTNASGWLMFFGSYSIFNHVITLNGNAHLFTYCGGGHEYSGELFNNDPQMIIDFIEDVLTGKRFQTHTIILTDKKDAKSEAYKFCD